MIVDALLALELLLKSLKFIESLTPIAEKLMAENHKIYSQYEKLAI